ncbi:MAG TPA: hypothetical protein VFW59_00945 [Gallionella sp.]|nr:hypothetical protein [Gallionella sp.]
MADWATRLNADCHAGLLDGDNLRRALRAEGEDFLSAVQADRPHLFSGVAYFVSSAQMEAMQAVVAAVESVVTLSGWHDATWQKSAPAVRTSPFNLGVFFGYDFHLNADGAHLIEINTNAGGAFLNALFIDSQREAVLPGECAAVTDCELAFVEMFRNEWRLARGEMPLHCIAIVDEQPHQQYLYPEFVLAQRMFERAGIRALIADPSELMVRADGLYCAEQKVDLVYNRLTDFTLGQHAILADAYRDDLAVLTPHPHAYVRYADKRNLALLTDAVALRAMGVADSVIATLMAGIPQTRLVQAQDHDQWWSERKQWFFKPAAGFGSKGSYSGAKLTKRVFEEIMQGGYVAQRIAVPGERVVCLDGAEPQSLKSDVRCYVYDGRVQLLAARLYQGQTTNFRTPGGGFSPVRVVE